MAAGHVVERVNEGKGWLPLGVCFDPLKFELPSRVPTIDPEAAERGEVARLRRKRFKLSDGLLSVWRIGRVFVPCFPYLLARLHPLPRHGAPMTRGLLVVLIQGRISRKFALGVTDGIHDGHLIEPKAVSFS